MAANPPAPSESDPNQNPGSESFPYFEDMNELETVFNRFDANGDGNISVDELDSVLRLLRSGVSLEDLHRIMEDLDTDRDGFISLMEFASFCRSDAFADGGSGEFRNTFNLYDRDKTASSPLRSSFNKSRVNSYSSNKLNNKKKNHPFSPKRPTKRKMHNNDEEAEALGPSKRRH